MVENKTYYTPHKPYITTKKINDSYFNDECKVFIPYGPLGIGKSAYACRVVAEVYGTKQPDGTILPNWEAVKDHLVFHPRDFVEKCVKMMEKKQKDKVLIWDDAGLWLFALEHNNPFIKAVIKYLNVARTNWAGLIFTTPLPTWVIKKVRGFPQAVSIKITKEMSDYNNTKANPKPRIATAYLFWMSPDMKHSGVRKIYDDKFGAMMPDDFFFDWYKPRRDDYARQAINMMFKELNGLEKEMAMLATIQA